MKASRLALLPIFNFQQGWPFTPRGGCGAELRKVPQWLLPLAVEKEVPCPSFPWFVFLSSLVNFKQGVSLVICAFSLVFQGFKWVRQGTKILGLI